MRPSIELLAITVLGFAAGSVSGMEMAATRHQQTTLTRPNEELVVLRATIAPKIDGELDDYAWLETQGRTGPFTKDGAIAKPYSDARLTWHDGMLFIALYAADEDIIAPVTTHDGPIWTGDSFHLVFRNADVERTIDVSARGVVTDGERRAGRAFDPGWESGVRAQVDRDGTVDDPSDEDEEWIVEMAIPLSSLGLMGKPGERVGLEISRCDHVRTGGTTVRTCAAWGDARSTLVLK